MCVVFVICCVLALYVYVFMGVGAVGQHLVSFVTQHVATADRAT